MAPGLAFPWYLRGNALYELEHFDRAVTAYKKALELDPYCADAWNNLGLSAFRMYHYDEALAAFEQAIARDPSNAFSWNNRGVVFQVLKRNDEAIDAPMPWQSIRNTENPSSVKAGHFLFFDGTLNSLIPTVKFSVLIQGMHKSGMTRVMPKHLLSCMMTR